MLNLSYDLSGSFPGDRNYPWLQNVATSEIVRGVVNDVKYI